MRLEAAFTTGSFREVDQPSRARRIVAEQSGVDCCDARGGESIAGQRAARAAVCHGVEP